MGGGIYTPIKVVVGLGHQSITFYETPLKDLSVYRFLTTFIPMSCLTPGESRILQHPNVILATQLLDLTPVPSKSYKTNIAIADRVNQWVSGFAHTPKAAITTPRSTQRSSPWTIVDPGACVEAVHPFKGWPSLAGKTITCIF